MLPHTISGSAEGGLVVWVPAVFGVIALAVGIRSLVRVLTLRANGVRVPGRITGRSNSAPDRGPTTSAATFEFTTKDGRHIRASQSMMTNRNLLESGREVTVAYDEQDPERAEILESASQVMGAVAFTGAGVVFLLVAFFMLG